MNERVNPSVARPVISQRAGVTVRRVGVNLGAEITGVDLRANALGRAVSGDRDGAGRERADHLPRSGHHLASN